VAGLLLKCFCWILGFGLGFGFWLGSIDVLCVGVAVGLV